MKICVNVPSINPEKCYRMIDSFYETMTPFIIDTFHFHIVAQNWSTQDIKAIGDQVTISKEPYSTTPSMMSLRMNSVYRFHTLPDYYMFIDDDIIFEDGFVDYFDEVMYSLKYVQPAVYQLFRNRYSDEEQFNPNCCIMTVNRGLFVKSNYIVDFPKEYSMEEGGGEDALIGYWALHNDNRRLVRGGAPIKTEGVKHFSIGSESFIHNTAVFDKNNGRLIRQLFQDPHWELLSGLLPKGIQR